MKNFAFAPLCLLTASLAAQAAEIPKVQLPAPYATPSASNAPRVVPQPDGAKLQVPTGFTVAEFASGFVKPRVLATAPGGELLISDSAPAPKGTVYMMSPAGGTKKALISGLDRPYGITFWKEYVYVGEPTSIKRYKFDAKAGTVGKGEEVVNPTGFDKGHWTRSITFDPKGTKLYVNVGSGSNVDPDSDPKRATILECNPDGSDCAIFAAGIRNATGIHFRPGSTDLWMTVQERDGLGDELVPDFFSSVKRGGFYGWPWAYFGPNEEPRHAGKNPDLVKKSITPEVSLGAHVAAMDWTFYNGTSFPAAWRNGAFIALRGSSNRTKRQGYSIAFVAFGKDGKPSAQPKEFLTGWMMGADQREVWGRPIGVTQLKDGSLVISEDAGNKLYRVSYGK